MTDEAVRNQAMRAVTISREYGSGGGEIATRLAQRLGWQLVDHELVARVARVLGEPEGAVAARDEHGSGLFERLIGALHWTGPWAGPGAPLTLDEETRRYHEAVTQVIAAAYRAGRVVLVGRGAQAFLAAPRDVLHLRIAAPLEQRVAYVVRREGLSPAAARERIRRKDEDRARYLVEHYQRRPDDAALYDLVINTGGLSLDDAVALSLVALERKAARLGVAAEALGPGGDLAAYPGQPGELMPARQEGEGPSPTSPAPGHD